jgi:arylsulfatase A-like enzyme
VTLTLLCAAACPPSRGPAAEESGRPGAPSPPLGTLPPLATPPEIAPDVAVEQVPDVLSVAQQCDFAAPPAPRDFATGVAPEGAPNVLIVLLDDVGIEPFARFGGTAGVPTPVLDGLADQGTVFPSAYVAPLCSPTRAELLTGRYNHRSGVGKSLSLDGVVGLPCEETTLAEWLDAAGWATSAIGKWHLSVWAENVPFAPLVHGFGFWRGSLANLGTTSSLDGNDMDHYHWERWTNGTMERVDRYSTTQIVDDALARIDALPEPWLTYVAFNAAHAPYQGPPAELVTLDDSGGAIDNVARFYGSVEALDAELGRLLDAVDLARTYVWVLSDNGSPGEIVGPPAKSTPYEAGVHVPMWLAGPGVRAGGSVDGFAQAVDVLPTLLDLLDLHVVAALDGVSLASAVTSGTPSPRDYAFAGDFEPLGGGLPLTAEYRMVRDKRFKLLREFDEDDALDTWHLYDMDGAGETVDLLLAPLTADAAEAYARLDAEYARITAP